MGDTGLEPVDVSDSNSNNLAKTDISSGAKSGATYPKYSEIDDDLQAVIDAWPDLPEPVQAGILAMVKASESV